MASVVLSPTAATILRSTSSSIVRVWGKVRRGVRAAACGGRIGWARSSTSLATHAHPDQGANNSTVRLHPVRAAAHARQATAAASGVAAAAKSTAPPPVNCSSLSTDNVAAPAGTGRGRGRRQNSQKDTKVSGGRLGVL